MTTAIAKSESKGLSTTLKSHLEGEAFRLAVAKVLPKHLTPDRFVRVALTAMTRTPKLAQCEQASFFQCLLTLSQLGLEPDGRRAHLIPFENRKRGCVECQLIVDYKGLAELAMRSGAVSNLHADIVCDKDEFDYDRGELKKHRINFREPRGEIYAAYAICRFKDGSEKCDVMTKHEIDAVRSRSRSGNNGPWVTDYNEMAKKTVFRRLSKWLPLSPEYRDALDADADAVEEMRVENARPVSVLSVVNPFDNAAPAIEEPQQEPITEPQPAHETAEANTEEITIQARLAEIVTKEAGKNFDAWITYAKQLGHVSDAQADAITSFDDVPTDIATRFVNARVGMVRTLKGAK
jgi:recombination protein RecT